MADTLNTTVSASVAWARTEALDLGNVVDSNSLKYSVTMADGTSASQADKVWHDERTLAASANDDLDLTALTQSIYGSTVTTSFAKVKGILIVVTTTTTAYYLTVGAAASAEWTAPFNAAGDKVKVGANSALLLSSVVDGWAVTDTSADTLRISNPSAGSVTYRITIWGASA